MSPQLLKPGPVTDLEGGAHCCSPDVDLQKIHSAIHVGRIQT